MCGESSPTEREIADYIKKDNYNLSTPLT